MKYEDLTLNQRIGLKGLFQTDPELSSYMAIWILWNFKVAINCFLTGCITGGRSNLDSSPLIKCPITWGYCVNPECSDTFCKDAYPENIKK